MPINLLTQQQGRFLPQDKEKGELPFKAEGSPLILSLGAKQREPLPSQGLQDLLRGRLGLLGGKRRGEDIGAIRPLPSILSENIQSRKLPGEPKIRKIFERSTYTPSDDDATRFIAESPEDKAMREARELFDRQTKEWEEKNKPLRNDIKRLNEAELEQKRIGDKGNEFFEENNFDDPDIKEAYNRAAQEVARILKEMFDKGWTRDDNSEWFNPDNPFPEKPQILTEVTIDEQAQEPQVSEEQQRRNDLNSEKEQLEDLLADTNNEILASRQRIGVNISGGRAPGGEYTFQFAIDSEEDRINDLQTEAQEIRQRLIAVKIELGG